MLRHRKDRGYPIPKSRLDFVQWVNDTPHLSEQAAADHRTLLNIGYLSYEEYVDQLVDTLTQLLDNPRHIQYLNYWANLARQGQENLGRAFEDAMNESDGSVSYMMDKLMEDKLEATVNPLLSATANDDIAVLYNTIKSLPDTPINRYELKLFNKYATDSSRRTGKGYLKQIGDNYLPSRLAWRNTRMPSLVRYNRAIRLYYKVSNLPIDYDGHLPIDNLRGFLSRARTTTFGGYPYLRNMGDFVSEDESDNTTYADLYNWLAIGFLFLPPRLKTKYNVSFVALERVQPGGVETYDEALNPSEQHAKDNKQRFVQAQSAMISHAYKFIVDAINIHMRANRPTMVADKFGEQQVTADMKKISSIAFNKQEPRSGSVTSYYNVVGTDYTNFDASQDVAISNDTSYMLWRRICPAWMVYYIIDPYVKMTYRDNSILVPKYGLIQTTGVKSGMADTNSTDTQNCALADIFELCYYSDEHSFLSDDEILRLVEFCMDNGDDRYKLTYCSADDIEQADGELGYIAQKQKQEIFEVGTRAEDFGVTYLKTILGWDGSKLVRTDAISKLILARIHPESISQNDQPYSLVIDFVMSASRSFDSPNLYILVDYMYARCAVFQKLIDGEIDMQYVIDHMVIEKMEELRLKRGTKWMRRKGMDYDAIIESMNTKYGYGDEGYRGNVGALTSDSQGILALPQMKAILSLAYERKVNGTLGSTFNIKIGKGN